ERACIARDSALAICSVRPTLAQLCSTKFQSFTLAPAAVRARGECAEGKTPSGWPQAINSNVFHREVEDEPVGTPAALVTGRTPQRTRSEREVDDMTENEAQTRAEQLGMSAWQAEGIKVGPEGSEAGVLYCIGFEYVG